MDHDWKPFLQTSVGPVETCSRCDVDTLSMAAMGPCRPPLYVSRPSIWGNPYVMGKICLNCGKLHDQPGSTIPCFEEYARKRIAREPGWLKPLLGKTLLCSGCKPGALTCHARVLERLRKAV